MLTQNELMRQLTYNPLTGVFAWAIRKPKVKLGAVAGTIKHNGYIAIRVNLKSYGAHRLAWLYVTGEWPEFQIDHKNGVRTDNRFSNLRGATQAENARNAPASKNSSTGIKGISPAGSRFRAQIRIGKRKLHLGYFSTKEEAAKAYVAATNEQHGDFAFSKSRETR